MISFAYNLDIPDDIMESEEIVEIEALCCEIGGLQNDVVSYRKEESEDVNHNIIAVCRLNGMDVQKAHYHIGDLINLRLQRLTSLVDSLPSRSPSVDKQLAVYAQAIKGMIVANVHWSFRSQRYFGLRNCEVRKTRLVDLLIEPPFMARGGYGTDMCI